MRVFVAQANSRDHGGEVLGVFVEEFQAVEACNRHMVSHNGSSYSEIDSLLQADALALSPEEFYLRYAGSAWIDSAYYSMWEAT